MCSFGCPQQENSRLPGLRYRNASNPGGRIDAPEGGWRFQRDCPSKVPARARRFLAGHKPIRGQAHGFAIWQSLNYETRETRESVAVTGRAFGAQIWGQTQCPVNRSGTSNVQRSTLNFQRSDRKGGCWAEYGDRHDVYWLNFQWGDRKGACWRQDGDRHDVYWSTGKLAGNAQRPTFNSQRSTG